MLPVLKRVVCPVCGKSVRLRKDGRVMTHGSVAYFENIGEILIDCSGSKTIAVARPAESNWCYRRTA